MVKKLILISLCLAFISSISGDISGLGVIPRNGEDYHDY